MKEYQTIDCRKMTPLSDIAPEVLQAIREAVQSIQLSGGYGNITVEIRGGKVVFVNHEIKKLFE